MMVAEQKVDFEQIVEFWLNLMQEMAAPGVRVCRMEWDERPPCRELPALPKMRGCR